MPNQNVRELVIDEGFTQDDFAKKLKKATGNFFSKTSLNIIFSCKISQELLQYISAQIDPERYEYIQLTFTGNFSYEGSGNIFENKHFKPLVQKANHFGINDEVSLEQLFESTKEKKHLTISINCNITAEDVQKISSQKLETLTFYFANQPINTSEVWEAIAKLKTNNPKLEIIYIKGISENEVVVKKLIVEMLKSGTQVGLHDTKSSNDDTKNLISLYNTQFPAESNIKLECRYISAEHFNTLLSWHGYDKNAQSIKLTNVIDSNPAILPEDKFNEIFQGLNNAPNIKEVIFERIKIADKDIASFFTKLATVQNITKLSLNSGILDFLKNSTTNQVDTKSLTDYLKKAENLQELTISADADNFTEILDAVIKEAKDYPKLKIKVSGNIKDEIETKVIAFNERKEVQTKEPAAPTTTKVKLDKDKDDQTKKPTQPTTTTPTGTNNEAPNVTLTDDEHVKVDNFVNLLLRTNEIEKPKIKFSHQVRIEQKIEGTDIKGKIKTELAKKIKDGMQGNPEFKEKMEKILQNDDTQDTAISTIIRSLNYLEFKNKKAEGAKVYNVGMRHGSSFADTMASFFYSILHGWNAFKDWINDHPIVVITNHEKFVEELTKKEPQGESKPDVSAIDKFIEKAAKNCGVDKSSQTARI